MNKPSAAIHIIGLNSAKFTGETRRMIYDHLIACSDSDPQKGHQAAYLHPIIRRFHTGKLVNEHHIQDDLDSEWSLPEYVEPV